MTMSRLGLLAWAAGACLAFGAGSAHATITDTFSLSQWETGAGVDSTFGFATPTSATIPITGGVTGYSTVLPMTMPAWQSTTMGTNAFHRWATDGGPFPGSGSGAVDTNVIKISSASFSTLIINVSNLAAFGFFFEGTTSAAFNILECTGDNNTNCSANPLPETPISETVASVATGGAGFFGYYGDAGGLVKSIEIKLVSGTAPTGVAIGQFYSVPVPEPATLGLVGFGLAALGMVRRRKRA